MEQPTTNSQQPEFGTWFFDTDVDKDMGIETCNYENGGVSKRAKLSDGRTAVCRRLKGKDRTLIKRIAGDDKDKFQDALIAVSTKIDDKEIVVEDLDALWFNDTMTIQTMATNLNFT